jgi:hypothetical protein
VASSRVGNTVVFFGAPFILLDIADYTRRTAEALEKHAP